MKNILATIPRAKFSSWEVAERVCRMCDGTTDREDYEDSAWFWLINTVVLPKQSGEGAVCFMIYDGLIRGYFDIVDTDLSENWREKHGLGKERTTQCIIMANWHPISEPISQRGFQGWRYTELRP